LKELAGIDPEVRIQQRIEKFDEMGVFEELNAVVQKPNYSH
jgi:hypothetical protein